MARAGGDESGRRLAIARRIAAELVSRTSPAAVLLAGSVALGVADEESDVDLLAYYEASLPRREAVDACRLAVAGGEPRVIYADDGSQWLDQYEVGGVPCQVGGATVAAWEAEMDEVLVRWNPDTPLQKAVGGVLHSVALHGEDLVAAWRSRAAAYPDGLARAMVEHHLRFFPLWRADRQLARRDAVLFRTQVALEAAFNLLGVLSGLNRAYFTTFQLKRMRAHIAELGAAPPGLAERLEKVAGSREAAPAELRSLVEETLALVEQRMPEVDTSAVRASLERART